MSPSAPAFSLTELLVVLVILALIAGLVMAGAPNMANRSALMQAKARLEADLDMAAIEARRAGQFGALTASYDGARYQIRLGSELIVTRALTPGLTLSLAPAAITLDPAGRWSAGALELENAHGRIAFIIDPITGRARAQGDGANGSAGRRRHTGRRFDRLLGGVARSAQRSRQSAHARSGQRHRGAAPLRGAPELGHRSLFRRARWFFLAFVLPRIASCSQPPAQADRMRGHSVENGPWLTNLRNRLGRASLVPAMSLMELMVALVVLGLATALVFSNIGPSLAMARIQSNEAQFWRGIGPAQSLLSELAAGAVDPAQRAVTASAVQFRTLAPRLSPTPITARFNIEPRETGAALVLSASELGATASIVLEAPSDLRFTQSAQGALILELRQRRGGWTPIAVAHFIADAPLTCSFDPIPRTCR